MPLVLVGKSGKMEEDSVQSSNEKVEMLAWSIAHDLKNPVLVVHSLTRYLYECYRDMFDYKGGMYCEQLLKSSEEIFELLGKINEYIITGEAALEIEQVNLHDLFQSVRDEFICWSGRGKARFAVLGDPPVIRADRLAVLKALRNLVDNALKYGGEEVTTVEIGYGEDEGHHIICVRDDGVGRTLSKTGKPCNQFVQLELSRNSSGSELDLSIIKNIAEKHQGRVWAEPAPLQGTIFCMSISKQL